MQFVRQCPGLTKADLVEMKSYAAPPKDIQRCMMGLCMLTSNPAAAKITTDAEAKKKLGTASFLKQIINLNLSQIPYENWERLTSIVNAINREPTSSTLLGRVHGFLESVLRNRPVASLQNIKSLNNSKVGRKNVKQETKTDERTWSVVSEKAINGLRKLNRGDLTELKSLRVPPDAICNDIAALVCVLLVGNANGTWKEAKALLSNVKTISKLLKMKPHSISRENLQKLQDLLAHSSLIKNVKQSSCAVQGFVNFAHAIVEFRCAPRQIPECQSFRHTRSRLSMYGALIPLD